MNHISHHLNPESSQTKHAADYIQRSERTEGEKPPAPDPSAGGAVFSQKALSRSSSDCNSKETQRNNRKPTGMVKEEDKTMQPPQEGNQKTRFR